MTLMLFLNQLVQSSIKILNIRQWKLLLTDFLLNLEKVIKVFFQFLIQIYQLTLSPIFGGACRFYPSCSCYAQEAFKNHNIFYALYLTWNRILNCRPGGKFGFDPVPEKENHSHE